MPEKPEQDERIEVLLQSGVTAETLRHLLLTAAREDLFASVVHEINNTLAAIVAHLDVLRQDRPDDPVVTEHLDVVIPQLERLAAILDRARSFTRTPDKVPARVDLGESLRAIAALVEYHYHTNDVSIELDIQQGLPPVLGHPGPLQQVWLNYLNNAFQALCRKESRGGSIRVKARYSPKLRQITVEITDEGVGMDVRTLKLLKDLSAGRRGAPGTSGIGMRESARIITEHKGSVDITSRPGRGTTVRITLPAAQSQQD